MILFILTFFVSVLKGNPPNGNWKIHHGNNLSGLEVSLNKNMFFAIKSLKIKSEFIPHNRFADIVSKVSN